MPAHLSITARVSFGKAKSIDKKLHKTFISDYEKNANSNVFRIRVWIKKINCLYFKTVSNEHLFNVRSVLEI